MIPLRLSSNNIGVAFGGAFYLLASLPVFAATDSGDYAIEGGGLQTCASFLAAAESKSPDIAAFGGWIEGYLTALNQQFDGVFDLTPWQNTPTLLSLTVSVCRQLPEQTPFIDGFDQVVRLLLPQALTAPSEVVALRNAEGGTFIYSAIITRLQERLRAEGHEISDPEGVYGPATEAAVRDYQTANGMTVSALPDQELLFRLLMRQQN